MLKKNALINKIDNIEFVCGEAENVIPKMYEEGIKADVVMVDPPRKGCDEKLLETIVKMRKSLLEVICFHLLEFPEWN